MMANAARDSLWKAKVRSEINRAPHLVDVISDKCIRWLLKWRILKSDKAQKRVAALIATRQKMQAEFKFELHLLLESA